MKTLRSERGSAVAEFALTSGLLALVVMGILQLTLVLHARAILIDCAAEGARTAALVGGTLTEGEERARLLATSALNAAYADDIVASRIERDGLRLTRVEILAPLPIVGFLGAPRLHVVAHALAEEQ